MVLPCLLALLALPSPALALAAFLASLLPAALLGTSLGQQVGLFFSSLLASISFVSLPPSPPEYYEIYRQRHFSSRSSRSTSRSGTS